MDSPGGFSIGDYEGENGAWIVKINWVPIWTEEYRVIEDFVYV
jgi:phosphoribosylformylglycinamidine (FGAM) synthase-like amidotransferase family enzyme